MEPFLPSEIARLVYGYLDEAKCDEAARGFLEHCSHLSECLAANKEGKGFNTKPAGYSLKDILDEYCEIRSMVAECLQKLPKNSADKLWQCDSLVEQLRYLIDSSQAGQMLLVSIRVPPKESPAKGTSSNVTPTLPTHNNLRIIGSSNRVKRTAVRLAHGTKQQSSKDADDLLSSISNSMLSVAATPLENLPGTSGNMDNESTRSGEESVNIQNVPQSGHTAGCEHVDPVGSVISHEASLLKPSIYPSNQCQKCCDKGRTSKYQQHSCVRTSTAVDSPNSSAIEDGPSCFSSPKRKHSCSSKRKSGNPTPMKGIHTPLKTQTPCKVRRSHTDNSESSENIDFSMLTQALLDNTELHKKIAENINKVIHKPGPGESLENSENHPFSSTVGDPGSAETYPMVAGCNSVVSSCDGVLQELNQTIRTIVEQTEQDPVFERFLDEIIAPLEEEMTPSSVDLQSEDDNAFPDLAVTTKPARNVNIDTHDATNTPNKKSSSLSSAEVTGCSKDQQVFQERRLEDSSGMLTNDVPLKQRLRSATQHKYDTASSSTSVNSMASSGKEKKREGTSLEDQNAAAIQCIVDAKISTQSIFEVSNSHQPQSNVCPSMPTSTVDSQILSTTTSGGNCHEKQGYFPGQLMKDGSVVTSSSLQKEVSQILDGGGGSVDVGSSNNVNIMNESVQNAEVILLDANLTFLDNNASFSLNTGTNSNFVTNSSVKTQLSAPLIATSQPSVSAAATNQIMTVMLPGTTGTIQQAATLGGISLYPPCEQPAPHSLATNSSSQVVAITIPGPQNVNSAVSDQMSTVIMCGSEGIIPQFITIPHLDSSRGSYLMSGASGPCRMPIVPRGVLIPKARTVHKKNAKPGPSKHAELSTSQRKKRISSRDEKKVVRNTVAVSTYSTVSKPSAVVGVTLSADNSRDNSTLKSPDTGQQSSAGCGLSLPSIILESPEAKMLSVNAQKSRVTPTQSNGQEKLSGALNLKEASDSSLNQKPMGNEQDKGIRNEKTLNTDGNESVKSKSELILQNVGKYPPSPQLMTLVNLSRSLAISGCPPSGLVPGTIGETTVDKVSEEQLTQKPRETPQSTTSRGRTSMDSKRLSLSTPRRHRHVRVLDFTTPPKARTVPKDLQPKEPSPNTVEKVTKTSRRTLRNGANKARSTLFKSHNESETSVCDIPLSTVISSVSGACSNNYLSVIPPIATRSPLPRLSGGWDNVAGVGQIICDESGSDFSVTETQYEVNEMDEQSEVTKGSTKLLKNREAGHKMTKKLAEESLVSMKSRQSSGKAWDFELRACLNVHDEGVQLSSNDSSSTTKKSTKIRKTKTKSRRSSHVTEEEVRSLEEHLNKDEHTDSGNLIKNQGSKNGASENTSSNLIVPYNTSTKSFEKTDYDSGAKNQNRDLNTVIAPLIKEKVECSRKNVEPTSESDHASLELVEKLPVMFSSKYKSCVPLPKLSKKKNGDQPADLSDNHGASDKGEVAREPDGKEQVKGVLRKEILALETSNSKKDDLSKSSSSSTMGVQRKEVLFLETSDSKQADLSKSSDSPTMETVSSGTSVGSLLTMASCFQVGQSPKEQEAGDGRILDHSMHIHQSPNSVAVETIVTHANDVGNSASLVVAASGTGCVLASGAASVADGQPVPVSQSEELVSSTSGFYPSESQNTDFQASSHKYSFSKEQSLANIPDKPLLKISGTQQVCDTVNMSDPQAKVVTSPILDTPRKINDPSSICWGTAYMSIPLTPRLRSPHPDDTPVTKQVNGNSCVAFSLIETPSFPPTPNIAVTPQSYHATQSTPSSATRSTEYSAGSAYYKPSDKLDCGISAKPLEQVLIEECRKLENTITAQTSNAYNESHMKDTDDGQQLSLSFTDKTFGEATSGTDFQVKVHVGKDMVLCEVDEGQGGVEGGTQSSKKRKRPKEMTKRSGVRNHKKRDKSKDKKITRKKAAGSLSKKASGIEDKPSEMYTLQRRKSRTVSGTAHGSCDVEQQSLRGQTAALDCTNRDSVYISGSGNKNNNFDDKPSETHTSASFSAQKKARTSNKNCEGQVDFLVDTLSPKKQQWAKETTKKSGVRGDRNSAISKGAKIAKKKKTGSPSNKASAVEDEPSELYTSSRRKTRPASGTAYKDFVSVSSEKKESAAGKRKARPNSRASKKRSNLENEPSETQKNLCKGLEGKIEDEIIQRCLDAAHSKLFGYSSPSDDSDFESSNDFGQSEVETKTVLSNDGKDERYTELKTAKESGTEQETETAHSSKLCSAYLGDGSSDVQHMVEPQRQDEVKCVSGLSLMREKSPRLPSSYCEEQMKETFADRTVNSESLLCHSEMSGFEIFPEGGLSVNNSSKSPLCFTNDSADTNLHTSSGKNITLNNKLVEKKCCTVAKLKDTDVSSDMPNSVVKECEERDGRAIFTSKSVPSRLEHSGSIENNPMCSDQDVDARNQLRDKEDSLTKTALAVPTKLIGSTGGETTQAKKNSHLSVEAIADRLTREKIAVQAHSLTQHQIGQPLTDDSSSEDFPVLHLSADYDSLSESMNLSQVESRLAKLHGVEGATSDVVAVESTPRSANDVCRDLERTPNRFQGVQSNVKLLPTVDILEHERQELVCKKESSTGKRKHGGIIANKKLSATERLKNTNKKIRDLLGDDVSPIKIVTEASEVSKDAEHGILNEVLSATVKHNSPIKGTVDGKLEDKLIQRSGISTAVKEMVQEKEVFSKQNKVCESAKMKTTNGSKFGQTSTIEVTDAVDTVGSRMEGLPSQGTIMKYERHQVSSNEAYIEIVYVDEGPEEHSLVCEDISNFSLTFELGEHLAEGVETYKCTISEFQELFCASPKECTSRSESCESDQLDVKRGNTTVNCTINRRLGYVTGSKDRDREFFHEGRNAGLRIEEHKTSHKNSADFSFDRMRSPHSYKGSPPQVYRRQTLSTNPGRKSHCFDHRAPSSSSSPVSVKSKLSTFSPLNELYDEYLKDERESMRFVSHCNKRDQYFNFRSRGRLPFGHRGRGRTRYYDRHIHSQRVLVHSPRESRRTSSSSSSSSHGRHDRWSVQEVRATEMGSTKVSGGTALLIGAPTAVKDMEQQPVAVDTQIKGVMCGRQKVLADDESPEEGELLDEDSVQELDEGRCNDKHVVWFQKHPSSVGNVQAEKLSEDTPPILKGNMSASDSVSDQSLEQNRSVEGRPSEEPEKTRKKSVQKEGSFAVPSAGRALPPKKRKASSEELPVQVEKRMRTDGPQALLKKVDLDHLLDFVHGEKLG